MRTIKIGFNDPRSLNVNELGLFVDHHQESWEIQGYGWEGNEFVLHVWRLEPPMNLEAVGSRVRAGQIVTERALNQLLNRIDNLERFKAASVPAPSLSQFNALASRSKAAYETTKDHIENLERGWCRFGGEITTLQHREAEVERQLVACAKLIARLAMSLKKSSFKKGH